MKVSWWKSRPWVVGSFQLIVGHTVDFYFALFLPGCTGYLQNGPIVHWLVMVHNVLGEHNCRALMCGTKLLHISTSPPPPHQQLLPSLSVSLFSDLLRTLKILTLQRFPPLTPILAFCWIWWQKHVNATHKILMTKVPKFTYFGMKIHFWEKVDKLRLSGNFWGEKWRPLSL